MLLLAILIFLLLLPLNAYADGISPLLYLFNWQLFLMGQVWIVFSESIYIKTVYRHIPYAKTLGITIFINAASTIPGVFIIPILGFIAWLTACPRFRPNSHCATTVAVFDMCLLIGIFIITYLLSVWIEYKLFYRWYSKYRSCMLKQVRYHSFWWNLISYSGILALFLWGYSQDKCFLSPFCFII